MRKTPSLPRPSVSHVWTKKTALAHDTSHCPAGDPVSPVELFKHKVVVVTSYNRVTSKIGRVTKFIQAMENYKNDKENRLPKRPIVTLLSGIFEEDGVKPLGKYLVLDEPHRNKNTKGRTYAASRTQ